MSNGSHSVKHLIRQAFVQLMSKKPYLDITVTDIVKEAGVARASFYRNYHSISDVMDDIIQEITSQFTKESISVIMGNDERKWRELLFNLFYRFPQMRLIPPEPNYENAGVWFSRLNFVIQQLENASQANTLNEKYAPVGKMGFVINILKKWMDTGMKESPEEMVNYIMTFISGRE